MGARTFLLDLDGTVWDSRPWYAANLAELSGIDSSEIETKLAGGANLVQVIRECGVSKSRMIVAANENSRSLRLYEGVRKTMNRLHQQAIPIGIVSNLPGWLVNPLIKSSGISQYIGTVVTPRPGIPPKPNPHGLWKAMEQMGTIAGTETWFVGDDSKDGEAAEAAAVRFAWASYGYATEEPSSTVQVIENFEDILQL